VPNQAALIAVSLSAARTTRVLGAPSMLLIMAGTGVLRGLQDTRTPLLVAVAANALNIALNALSTLDPGNAKRPRDLADLLGPQQRRPCGSRDTNTHRMAWGHHVDRAEYAAISRRNSWRGKR
jgi:hypothetical protein